MHEIDLELKLQLEGKHKEARAISDRLQEIGPDKILDPFGKNTQDIWFRHSFNRGWFLLQDGLYQEGCKLLEHGRFLNVYGSPPLKTDAPIFNPEKDDIKGKSIIISLEGGYGDEIIHARFAKSFKKLGAEKVYLAAAPELISMFERMESVDKVILRNQAHTVPHDFWVPGFSAGWLSGNTFENFENEPFLKAIPESVEVWKNLIQSDKIKVGIRWAGNPKFEHQQFRRFPPKFITNLAKYPELQLYSLQRDHNLVRLPENVVDLQHMLVSWEDTMAAIENLDIVVTSCTSIAHLAASMGKETWVITPILPYHTWTHGAPESRTSPYYKCVRIFRQDDPKGWNSTFSLLYKELEERLNLQHIEHTNEDRVTKRINLGCGTIKFEGFVNVDKSPMVKPDELVDLDVVPWKWDDDEFDHIVAKDILEHLGDKPQDLIKYIKEMYRITTNGGIWEVVVPHWRCDIALDDLTHKRLITRAMFNLFNKKALYEGVAAGRSESLLAFEEDVDIEVCDVQFEYNEPYRSRILSGTISDEELTYSLNNLNNVAYSMRLLIQVHKPGRYDRKEMEDLIDNIAKANPAKIRTEVPNIAIPPSK
jgi:hypothetical protein